MSVGNIEQLKAQFDGFATYIWDGNVQDLQSFCTEHGLSLNYTIWNYNIYFCTPNAIPPEDSRIKEV
jgi:hypothetical protein